MKRFEGKIIRNGQPEVLGVFNTEDDAISALVYRAKKSGAMCGETDDMLTEGLKARGFYNVGYSNFELEVNEVNS